jgi:hypothetical protein
LYEQRLKKAQLIAAISPNDTQYFSGNYSNAFWLPPFHPNDYITTKPGMGSYILYHGDLSVTENVQAIQFLFRLYPIKTLRLFIAGRNPSELMRKEVSEYHNFVMVSNPSFKEMERLINDAHVIALPTFQATGIKLKLIASLFLEGILWLTLLWLKIQDSKSWCILPAKLIVSGKFVCSFLTSRLLQKCAMNALKYWKATIQIQKCRSINKENIRRCIVLIAFTQYFNNLGYNKNQTFNILTVAYVFRKKYGLIH